MFLRITSAVLVCGLALLSAQGGQNKAKSHDPDPFFSPPKKKQGKQPSGLIQQLKDRNPRVRLKVIEAVALQGDVPTATATALCDAVMDLSPRVATAALQAVEKVRPELYKPLTTLIVDRDAKNRLTAVKELGLMGEKATPTTNVLLTALRRELALGPDRRGQLTLMQQELFTAVRQIKPDDSNSVSIYKAIASPSNRFSTARSQALEFLFRWAGNDEMRRKEMLPLIKAGVVNATCQIQCINYLGEYGSLAKECVPQLKQLKLSSDSAVRDAAMASLDKIENQ
jgi:hypothetical protein